MERKGLFYGRNMIRFSLKNATKELSPIRLRKGGKTKCVNTMFGWT